MARPTPLTAELILLTAVAGRARRAAERAGDPARSPFERQGDLVLVGSRLQLLDRLLVSVRAELTSTALDLAAQAAMPAPSSDGPKSGRVSA